MRKKKNESLKIVPIDMYDLFSHLEWVLQGKKNTSDVYQLQLSETAQIKENKKKNSHFISLLWVTYKFENSSVVFKQGWINMSKVWLWASVCQLGEADSDFVQELWHLSDHQEAGLTSASAVVTLQPPMIGFHVERQSFVGSRRLTRVLSYQCSFQ